MLSASFDESGQSCRRRPHLSDGFCTGPEVYRAASTSPTAAVGRSPAKPLRPLCGWLPQVMPRSRGIARGPGVTCAPPPPSPCAASACPQHQSVPSTNRSGPSPAATAPHATPIPWPFRARVGAPPASYLVPGPLSPLCYGVGGTPAQPPTSRRFFNSRQAKHSLTNTHAPLLPLPLRGLNGRIVSLLASGALRRRSRRAAAHSAICSLRNMEGVYTRSTRRRSPCGSGAPSHSRSASSGAGRLFTLPSRTPWLLSTPLYLYIYQSGWNIHPVHRTVFTVHTWSALPGYGSAGFGKHGRGAMRQRHSSWMDTHGSFTVAASTASGA
jgi:hypothetical protein